MVGFSASEAAFSGFRLVRARPGAVAAWAIALLLFGLVIWAAMFALGFPRTLQAIWPPGQTAQDPAVMQRTMRTLLPMEGGLMLLELLFYPILISAVLRTFLDPRPRLFGGIRVGADELRMLWLIIRMGLVLWLIDFVSILVGVVASVLVTFLVRAAHPPAILDFLPHTLILLLVFAWIVYVKVRFSLALVVTAAEKRRGLRRSWRLTKGHFWPLLGSYILMFFIVLVCEAVILTAMLAIIGIGLVVTHVSPLDAFKALLNPGSNPTVLAVFWVANAAMIWFFAALFAVMFGPSVEAYRAFSAPKAAAL
jgi:hypothetical protein